MKFSERYGFRPIREQLQLESIDEALKNGLWNCVYSILPTGRRDTMDSSSERTQFCRVLWHSFFKLPLDTISEYWSTNETSIRKYYFNSKWHEIYDFLEFCASDLLENTKKENFIAICNSILERECSAYRFVNDKITPTTSEVEVAEIERAIDVPPELRNVSEHLKAGLRLLSDRNNPDYRNSIKESISAVENLCRCVTGDKRATLGAALKIIDKSVPIHPALKSAFNKLYGYTNDAKGIRHALTEGSEPDFYEAKFMLVTCSAFVNYVIGVRPQFDEK